MKKSLISVPQGSVLIPLLFIMYVNSISGGLVSQYMAFADNFQDIFALQ